MSEARTFCCLACRLLQDPATSCVECNSHLMAALDTAKTLLVRSDFEPKRRLAGWRLAAANLGVFAGYAALVGAAIVWWPAIPIAAGAGVAAGGFHAWRRRGVLATVSVLPPAIGDAAATRAGVAHRLDATFDSIVDGTPALVEESTILLRGRVVFRRVRAVPFLLALDGGDRLVVAGVMRPLIPVAAQPRLVRKNDSRFVALGIPPLVRAQGDLATRTVRDGDAITVTGESSVEIVPELAFHRDAGETAVIRGRAGSVVRIA